MNKYKGIIFCTVASIFWGISSVFGEYLINQKNAVTEWIIVYRLFFAGSILVIFNFIKYGKKNIEIFKKRSYRVYLILTSVCGVFLSQLTYFYTIQFSNAGIATILQFVAPVFILIFVCYSTHRLPKIYEVFAIITSFVGVMLIALCSNTDSFILPPKAVIIGLISALTVVGYNLLPLRLTKVFNSSIIVGWASFFSGIVAFIIFRPYRYTDVIIDFGTFLGMFGVTVIGVVFAYTLYFSGVKYVGPQPCSIIASLEPITSVVVGYLWLGTTLTISALLGTVLIILSIISITFFNTQIKK